MHKLPNSSENPSKKMKVLADSDTASDCVDTILSVCNQIRTNIAKWVRSQRFKFEGKQTFHCSCH